MIRFDSTELITETFDSAQNKFIASKTRINFGYDSESNTYIEFKRNIVPNHYCAVINGQVLCDASGQPKRRAVLEQAKKMVISAVQTVKPSQLKVSKKLLKECPDAETFNSPILYAQVSSLETNIAPSAAPAKKVRGKKVKAA